MYVPRNSISGSAVCVFNISDFQRVFDGPYKSQENPQSWWLPRKNTDNNNKCASEMSTVKTARAVAFNTNKRSHESKELMDEALATRQLGPLIMRENER